MGTAKLYIQAYALTRNPWPTRREFDQTVDWAWTKAVRFHDKQTNVEMPPPRMGILENKLAREIVSDEYFAKRRINK
jgi:hypothetical protein